MFGSVTATPAERGARRPGDDLVAPADVVMDRAFTAPTPPEVVWPWLVQLGKRRAGWYLPASLERFVPRGRRALRHLDPQWQGLSVGDVIPDYGGPHETFRVATLDPPHSLVYTSSRGHTHLTWSITLVPTGAAATRVCLRLRMAPVRRVWLASTLGELVDALTVAGMAAGLNERLRSTPTA